MDVIALIYADIPDSIELRRMDWTRVNTIGLGNPATALCFSPDGRTICVATASNQLLLFGIERSPTVPSMRFDIAIAAVHMATCNGIPLTIVAFADATVSVFSDFHFTLANFVLPAVTAHIGLADSTVFLLLEDGRSVSRFRFPFLETESLLIRATSAALASYWHHHDIVEGATGKLADIWKRIWEEASPFTAHGIALAQAFLCGGTPPELSTEVHRGRIKRSIGNEIVKMRKILAEQIIPSFLELDRATEKLQAALDIAPGIGIEIRSIRSDRQLRNCLSMLENLRKTELCFTALFDYLEARVDATPVVSTAEFTEFLVKHLRGFDLLDIGVGEGPISKPIFAAEQQVELELPSRYSCMRGAKCVCLSDALSVVDLQSGDHQDFEVEGHPLSGFPFDDDTVGCFYEDDGCVKFVLLGCEDSASYKISLVDAAAIVISPRKIAFVASSQAFCTVVDLQPSRDEEGGEGEDE
jgi:hypothetical protein